MAGTKSGGQSAYETNIAKYGADFYRRIGSLGGKKGDPHKRGFAVMSPEKRSAAGRKGGAISRRRKRQD